MTVLPQKRLSKNKTRLLHISYTKVKLSSSLSLPGINICAKHGDMNMNDQFGRTELLLGNTALQYFKSCRVAVFGIGGVGGYAAEAIARSGIGEIDLIDDDRVALSNINRQIIAVHSTVGQYKTDVMEKRLKDINPDIKIHNHKVFFNAETSKIFDFSLYDYVVDAIDSVSGKIEIIMQCDRTGTPVISSMGAGNKLNPAMFEVEDIYKTSVCPLARVMRSELKKRGIKKLKVVYSKEKPIMPEKKVNASDDTLPTDRAKTGSYVKQAPGSCAFVPSAAGLIIAGEVIKDLAKKAGEGANNNADT